MKLHKLFISSLLCMSVLMPSFVFAEVKVGIVNLSRVLNEVQCIQKQKKNQKTI